MLDTFAQPCLVFEGAGCLKDSRGTSAHLGPMRKGATETWRAAGVR
jgi:hypothetical protein